MCDVGCDVYLTLPSLVPVSLEAAKAKHVYSERTKRKYCRGLRMCKWCKKRDVASHMRCNKAKSVIPTSIN